ncbi:MAG: hypothetical protein IJK81_02615 [Selenomonadaceae bacterium]|nr:hypothetical protein [Selenomonadaceae bacterium]
MKKISILAAVLLIVAISSTALAANWVYIATREEAGFDVYVDKDSIRHGIHSAKCNITRNDGFSAHIDLKDNQGSLIFLVWFWRENGKKHCKFLEVYDENGNSSPYESGFPDRGTEIAENDTETLMVFDYVENNLRECKPRSE